MCGRYNFSIDEQEMVAEINQIIKDLSKKFTQEDYKTGEIFPTNRAPILLGQNQPATIMNWGYPKWDNKGVVINARSETAGEKKMFAKSLSERRCVIPTTGFYEWQKRDAKKPKDKFLFRSNEGPVLYLAGIYNEFQGQQHFVILTRDANVSIADIHDRMPVVLHQHELQDWINDPHFSDFLFLRDDIVLRRQAV